MAKEHQLKLTLRTLLAYLDDTLSPADTRQIGQRLAENPAAQELADRIRKVTRRRSLGTPPPITFSKRSPEDPNVVAGYLSDTLPAETLEQFESVCLESDIHLAEVAACHQILTLILCEKIRVPPVAYQRMYRLVQGRESQPDREPSNVLPVGGALPDGVGAAEADDTDAPFLLGMPAYTRSEPVWKRGLRAAMAAVLLIGFLMTAWIVWPKGRPAWPEPPGLALQTPTHSAVPEPAARPKSGLGETSKPVDPSTIPPKPVDPNPPKTVTEKPIEPMPKPKPVELIPDEVPPQAGEVVLGEIEAADQAVVIARKGNEKLWKRVGSKDQPPMTQSRLICLPGYKAKLKLSNGAAVELWANLPDLLPMPILETDISFHLPYEGFNADFTLNCGRIFVTTTQPSGSRVRLRVLNEIWDLTLPDAKTEIAIEVVNQVVPGLVAETPLTSIRLYVVKGSPSFKARYKEIAALSAGDTLYWSNKGKGLEGPVKDDPKVGRGSDYFSRLPTYPNEKLARPALEALDEFSKRLTEKDQVRPFLRELVREGVEPTPKSVAEGRLGVLTYAAIADWDALFELLGDGTRHGLRQTTVSALRIALANQKWPEVELRMAAADKLKLKGDELNLFLRLTRGASAADAKNPEFLDQVGAALSSPNLTVRELAFATLILDVDSASQSVPRLAGFNAGAPEEIREPMAKAWLARIAELKKSGK